MHHEQFAEAIPGDNVGFKVKGLSVTDIKRVYVASDAKNVPAADTKFFKAQIIVINYPGQIMNVILQFSIATPLILHANLLKLKTRWKNVLARLLKNSPKASRLVMLQLSN